MPERDEVAVSIEGTGNVAGAVEWDISHIDPDGGEAQFVRLTLSFWEFDIKADFSLDDAERFIVQFRDEVVRAKQAELEWQTNTDPESGVAGDCD